MDGVFESAVGNVAALLKSDHEVEGWVLVELDTNEVFIEGKNLTLLDRLEAPGISVVGGMNLIVGVLSECFEGQTAVLVVGDYNFIFEHRGVLLPGKVIQLKSDPLSAFPVNI